MDEQSENQQILATILKEHQDNFKAIANEYNQIPERIFVHFYLPMFAGVADRPNPEVINLSNWSQIAGGSYRRMAVVNPAGEILFLVPPLLDHSAFKPISENVQSVGHMVATAAQLEQRSPKDAQRYLNAEFAHTAADMLDKETSAVGYAKEWNEIFKRYGYAEITQKSEEVKAALGEPTPTTQPTPIVFDDYEDL